ncbi:MAG: hypothetical protein KIT68_12030 [Phycisphaeraceae bacterium]|nr:hypothetical protein [Phycisphaeraceae bacterium]
MIVVAIIGILASIALPAYSDYIRRSKIVEATSVLSDLRVRMEQFYQDNRSYDGAALDNCGAGAPAVAKNFTFNCRSLGQTYTATATGSAGRMVGFGFTINEQNVRATTATPAGWGGAQAACWISRKGHC